MRNKGRWAVLVVCMMLVCSGVILANQQDAVFSLDSLSLFDGQDGNPAYVAYQGRVYDVSETWPTGSHRGFPAGTDITEPMAGSAHGTPVLDKLSQVGYLAANLWTEAELEGFSGQGEHPPYVAVDGIVYDVTATWPGGMHQGYPAGTDISDPIDTSAHGLRVLDNLPVVGVIVEFVLSDDELESFNGKDGNRGLIAVNGVIYDVSETWPSGSHRGFNAGNDITEAIAGSAHGLSVLTKLPIVGRLD